MTVPTQVTVHSSRPDCRAPRDLHAAAVASVSPVVRSSPLGVLCVVMVGAPHLYYPYQGAGSMRAKALGAPAGDVQSCECVLY
jgi:hypothetical protein